MECDGDASVRVLRVDPLAGQSLETLEFISQLHYVAARARLIHIAGARGALHVTLPSTWQARGARRVRYPHKQKSLLVSKCVSRPPAHEGAPRGVTPARRRGLRRPRPPMCAKPRKSQSAPPRRRRTSRGRRGRGQLHLPEDRLSRGPRGGAPPPAHSWPRACRDAVSPSPTPPL